MDTPSRIGTQTRYCRRLEGADFSLEVNTEAVPEAGYYYLLRGGQVVLRTDDYASAEGAYQRLCREHWEVQLASADAEIRRRSAIGLLSEDPGHHAAAEVLRQDGSPADHTRLERARNARRSAQQREAMSQRRARRSE